jgi:hypothetical protein
LLWFSYPITLTFMVAICNTNNKRLYSHLFAYESILRADLLPSVKIVAQVLVYQGALEECGCCISNEITAGLTGLDVTTVHRQVALLTKLKIFHRHRRGGNNPYTYHFNRNTEEWEVKRYV